MLMNKHSYWECQDRTFVIIKDDGMVTAYPQVMEVHPFQTVKNGKYDRIKEIVSNEQMLTIVNNDGEEKRGRGTVFFTVYYVHIVLQGSAVNPSS